MSEKNGKSSDLLKKNQEKIRPLFNDALLNYSSKNYNKAIECLEKILKIDPMNSDAWYKLGLNYSSLNNFPKAIECYEKSIEIKPNDAFVLNKLKQCLKKAAEINPGDKTVFNKLLTLENKNKVQYKPEMPDTELKSKKSEKWQKYDQYRKLGKDSMEKHDYQNAIQYFEKSLEISVGTQLGDKEIIENLAISYFKLGVDLKERKDYQNTIKYLYKALEITSKSEKRLQIIDLIADSLILDKAKIHQMIIELSKSHPEITLEKLTEKLKSSEQKNLYEKYSLVLIGDESEKLIERLIEKMVNNREIQAQIKENLVIFKKDSPAEVRMSEHELKKWYDLGMMLFAKKNWIKAIEFFEKVIKIDPNYDKIIWPALGQCYIEIGDFQKSFECAQKALEIDPDSANWMNMGLAYRNLKNLDKAIECFEKTVELAPDFKDAWDILARSYAEKELKTPHKLIKCLENLTRIDPNDRDSWFKLGMCYEVLKDGPNAEKCYLKILKFEPSNEKVISRLIIASEIMGDYKKVVEYSNKFLKTNPNSIEILQYLAIAFDKLNNHKEAVKIFEKLVNLLPDDKILRRNLGLAYAKVGKIKKAVDSFEKAIELDPNFKKAWINLNEAYKKLGDEKRRNKFYNRFKKSIERLNVDIKKQIKIKEEKATGFLDAGNFQEAIKLYEEILEISPKRVDILCSIGAAYFGLKNYSKTLEYMKNFAQFRPKDEDLWMEIMKIYLVYYKSGTAPPTFNFNHEIKKFAEKFIQINPNKEKYWAFSYYIFNEMGSLQEAINCLEKAVEINPNSMGFWCELGRLSINVGDFSKAINYLETAIKLDPNSEEVWQFMGVAYQRLGNHQKAAECFDKYRKLKNSF